MDPIKVEGITQWPTPTTVKEVRSFLGFCKLLPCLHPQVLPHSQTPQRPYQEIKAMVLGTQGTECFPDPQRRVRNIPCTPQRQTGRNNLFWKLMPPTTLWERLSCRNMKTGFTPLPFTLAVSSQPNETTIPTTKNSEALSLASNVHNCFSWVLHIRFAFARTTVTSNTLNTLRRSLVVKHNGSNFSKTSTTHSSTSPGLPTPLPTYSPEEKTLTRGRKLNESSYPTIFFPKRLTSLTTLRHDEWQSENYMIPLQQDTQG
jgi:hypothetical protein